MSQILRSSNPPLQPSKDPKGEQKANRECLRRVRAVNRLCDCRAIDLARRIDEETPLTQRKQTLHIHSNREVEALFFGPCRGGPSVPFTDPPPGFSPRAKPRGRPRLRCRLHPTHPPFLFRLDSAPTVYFHPLTDESNCTHVSTRAAGPAPPSSTGTPACVESRRAHKPGHTRAAETSTNPKPNSKTLTTHPSILLRLKRPPLLYFQELTRSFNLTV